MASWGFAGAVPVVPLDQFKRLHGILTLIAVFSVFSITALLTLCSMKFGSSLIFPFFSQRGHPARLESN